MADRERAYLTDPFIRREGSYVNKYMDYKKRAEHSKISLRTAQGIAQSAQDNKYARAAGKIMADIGKEESASKYKLRANEIFSGSFASSVGKKVANTNTYNNSAAAGQCVWYARGRAKEKLGV